MNLVPSGGNTGDHNPAMSVKVPSASCEWDNAEGSSQTENPVETVRRPPTNGWGEDTVRSRQQWREADRDARLARSNGLVSTR